MFVDGISAKKKLPWVAHTVLLVPHLPMPENILLWLEMSAEK